MQTIFAGLVYFGIVFSAGFILGIFRQVALTPVYGEVTAVMIEAPFMLVAIAVGAWVVIHRASLSQSKLSLLMVGFVGFVLVQIADFGVGLGLRAMSIQDQIAYLKTSAGQIYLAMLAIFFLMPLILGHFIRSRRDTSASTTSEIQGPTVTD